MSSENWIYEVHAEVLCMANNGSTKHYDIILIDENRDGFVIDSTIRLEDSNSQPEGVHLKKKSHYEPNFT